MKQVTESLRERKRSGYELAEAGSLIKEMDNKVQVLDNSLQVSSKKKTASG